MNSVVPKTRSPIVSIPSIHLMMWLLSCCSGSTDFMSSPGFKVNFARALFLEKFVFSDGGLVSIVRLVRLAGVLIKGVFG